MKSFTYHTLELGYNLQGKGTPVVFLSGWGYGVLMGEAAVGPLIKKGCRLLTVDVPGTGSMGEHSSFVHIPRLAKTIAALMREEGMNEAVVIGHAFGAMLAQEMALSEDDVVQKLVLMSALPGIGLPTTTDLSTAMDMLNRLLVGENNFFEAFYSGGFISQLKTMLGSAFAQLNQPANSAALSGQVWAASRWNSLSRLNQIYQPTLFLHGKADVLSPLALAQMMATQIPNATLEKLECGYLPFLEKRTETLEKITSFINNP